MRNHWLDSVEDLQWLSQTHLKGLQLPDEFADFQSAIIQGNEDCPYAVNLYVSRYPTINDDFCRIKFADCPPSVVIFCGSTGELRQ